MTQAYSNPARQNDLYALPDVEIFEYTSAVHVDENTYYPGWYYWFCLPGCLPDSDPIGPFESYDAALQDAQADLMDESDE